MRWVYILTAYGNRRAQTYITKYKETALFVGPWGNVLANRIVVLAMDLEMVCSTFDSVSSS